LQKRFRFLPPARVRTLRKACPRQNIALRDGKPVFGDRCVICLNCIYSCPQKALEPGRLRFVAIRKATASTR
jgi:Fe-S-cluster-containing hydrogenase component 2